MFCPDLRCPPLWTKMFCKENFPIFKTHGGKCFSRQNIICWICPLYCSLTFALSLSIVRKSTKIYHYNTVIGVIDCPVEIVSTQCVAHMLQNQKTKFRKQWDSCYYSFFFHFWVSIFSFDFFNLLSLFFLKILPKRRDAGNKHNKLFQWRTAAKI